MNCYWYGCWSTNVLGCIGWEPTWHLIWFCDVIRLYKNYHAGLKNKMYNDVTFANLKRISRLNGLNGFGKHFATFLPYIHQDIYFAHKARPEMGVRGLCLSGVAAQFNQRPRLSVYTFRSFADINACATFLFYALSAEQKKTCSMRARAHGLIVIICEAAASLWRLYRARSKTLIRACFARTRFFVFAEWNIHTRQEQLVGRVRISCALFLPI